MPHDPLLVARIRPLLAGTDGLVEHAQLGGFIWAIRGNVAVGMVDEDRLMVCCSKEDHPVFLREPGAEGIRWGDQVSEERVMVDVAALASDEDLQRWVSRGRAYAESLPDHGTYRIGRRPRQPRTTPRPRRGPPR